MTTLTVLLPVLGVLSGQYVPDSNEFLSNDALRKAGLQRYWQAELPVPTGEEAALAALVDEQLYVVTNQGSVAAFHAPTGMALWARNLNEGQYRLLPPTHLWTADGPGPTAVVSAMKVYLLDRLTGEELAAFPLPFAYGTQAVGDLEMLYLGSADGHMYGVRWDLARAGGGPVRVWRVRTGGALRSRPAFDGTNLWFASTGGEIYSCEADDKLGRWTVQAEGGVVANLVRDESGIYAATTGRSVYRLDPETGQTRWRVRLPTPLEEGPIVAGQTLYQTCGDAGLYAIDIDSGNVAWSRPDVGKFVARKANEVTVLAADGERLMVLNNGTGQEVRSLVVYDADLVVPNPYDDAIYMVSRTNQVVCLRPADVPYLTLEAIAAARARLVGHAQESDASTTPPATPPPSPLAEDVLRSDQNIRPLAGR